MFVRELRGRTALYGSGIAGRAFKIRGPVVRCRDAVVGPELRELSLALKRALPGGWEGVSILPTGVRMNCVPLHGNLPTGLKVQMGEHYGE